MRQAITVEARFEAGGSIRPLTFEWRGRRHVVVSLGRQWDQDNEQHFLVMTPDDRVYELALAPDPPRSGGTWWLCRAPEGGRAAA
jgi:hypothetical protein